MSLLGSHDSRGQECTSDPSRLLPALLTEAVLQDTDQRGRLNRATNFLTPKRHSFKHRREGQPVSRKDT